MEYKKKILVVGSQASAYTIAQKMAQLDNIEVFVAPGSDAISEFANIVDIRENAELLEFVLENDINLTVVTSDKCNTDIATLFQKNNQLIFCPTKESSLICDNKVFGKKFMYHNNIPCPNFGIYDKPNFAYSYLEKSNFPVVIKTEYHKRKGICISNNIASAKNFIENLFALGENKILIEDYIWGHEFSFYVITDGYQALPLGCVATYKYELEGNGGAICSGMGAFSDNYRISNHLKNKIMTQIINPTIEALSNNQTPYVGILGVDLVVDDNDNLYTIEYNNFLKDPDSQVILELLNNNLYQIFESCAIGAFADDYEYLKFKDENAISCVLCSGEIPSEINGLENLDEETVISHCNTKKTENHYETNGGQTLILTRKSRVLSKAVKDLYDEIDVIKYNGKKYRRDIGVII
jgi:phosphoribosylamine--glycine ligase